MECRWNRSVVVLILIAVAGCNSSSSTTPSGAASAPTTPSDPAARTAHEFLEAVVKGDTARASQLLTPLAVERITASGKTLKLLGLENYAFRVEGVGHPTPDQAYVHCFGKDRSASAAAAEEEYYWMLRLVDNQWRIWAISYTPAENQPQVIFSLENPEMGAVPVQQVIAAASKARAGASRPSPSSPQLSSPPRTAQEQEAVPAAYR
jgi:hypothetical protein